MELSFVKKNLKAYSKILIEFHLIRKIVFLFFHKMNIIIYFERNLFKKNLSENFTNLYS